MVNSGGKNERSKIIITLCRYPMKMKFCQVEVPFSTRHDDDLHVLAL